MKLQSLFLLIIVAATCGSVNAIELPDEIPLWSDTQPQHQVEYEEEKVRSPKASRHSPSGSNRVFSHISKASYSIHRPENPNGVGLVICPGGGYFDVWLDREGHDLALRLKEHGITSLVLKYRTNSNTGEGRALEWKQYLPLVEEDARQAIRILRNKSAKLELDTNKIGIGGFSAGGNLALLATLNGEPKGKSPETSGTPDFTGLFYPWFREDYSDQLAGRAKPESAVRKLGPVFMMNAADDTVTPTAKCVEFYSQLLKSGVNAELHVFSKGGHGFDLGQGKGESASVWPTSFVAWLKDAGFIDE